MADCVLVTRSAPHHLVLTLCGEIDLMLAAQLADASSVIARDAPAAVHLDLQRVTFFSARAVGFVAELHDMVSRDHAALTIAPIPECVDRAMRTADPSLTMHLHDSHGPTDAEPGSHSTQGDLGQALAAGFSAEARASIRHTVARTAERERTTTNDGIQHHG
jgi:anti-anti-sigma factor